MPLLHFSVAHAFLTSIKHRPHSNFNTYHKRLENVVYQWSQVRKSTVQEYSLLQKKVAAL